MTFSTVGSTQAFRESACDVVDADTDVEVEDRMAIVVIATAAVVILDELPASEVVENLETVGSAQPFSGSV